MGRYKDTSEYIEDDPKIILLYKETYITGWNRGKSPSWNYVAEGVGAPRICDLPQKLLKKGIYQNVELKTLENPKFLQPKPGTFIKRSPFTEEEIIEFAKSYATYQEE